MKITSILVSVLAVSTIAHADEFSNLENPRSGTSSAFSTDEMALVSSTTQDATAGMQTTKVEEPTMFGKANSTWNFNLGMSEFDYTYESGYGTSGTKGKGLTFEIQKRFWDMFYVGAAYTNYTTEGLEFTDYNQVRTQVKSYMDVMSLSMEGHVIRMPLPARSEFFAAVNAGMMAPVTRDTYGATGVSSNYFIGAGVGVNISNQIGLRADIKSTTTVRAYNSVSLVGYY